MTWLSKKPAATMSLRSNRRSWTTRLGQELLCGLREALAGERLRNRRSTKDDKSVQ